MLGPTRGRVFDKYFQEELAYLRDAGRALAAKHPSMGGLLGDRSADPSIERLLEGFAFVAARLRQRTSDPAPEPLQGMTELLLPAFLRPTPASTIVEFRAESGAAGQRIPAGATLLSRPVRDTVCPFRTTRAVDLAPLKLVSQQLDDSSAYRPELTLRFEVRQGGGASVFRPEGLRLHLHGDFSTVTQLYLWFARHVSGVTARSEDGRSVELGSSATKLVGLDDADPLFPWPSFSPQGLRLLLEYFAQPAKFMFIDVVGLDKAAHLGCTKFELAFRFTRPPALPQRLAADALRLHCVPAINLFEAAATIVRKTGKDHVTVLRPGQAEVFEVRSVVERTKARPEPRHYESAHSFGRRFRRTPQRSFYQLKRRLSPLDGAIETSIHIEPSPDLAATDEATLTIDFICTSRLVPNELRVGDVCVPTRETPDGVQFSNISAVTRPTRPQLDAEEAWHFIAHLSASRNILTDIEVLKTLLLLYNFQERSDHPKGRANRARIEAIGGVSSTIITRLVHRAAMRGRLFRVEVAQESFASEGEAFLFGSVLQRMLGDRGGAHSFVDLELVLMPSELSFRWKAAVP